MWGVGKFPCLVHYADHSISGKFDLPPVHIENGGNLTEHVKLNLTEFDQIWDSLMDDLVKKVTWGSIWFKFATKEAKLNAFEMIYSLMQCTQDPSQSDCDICLRQSVADFQACCLRSARGKKDQTSRTIIIIIVVASAAVMISIISIGILIFRVKKSRQEIERVTEIQNSKSLQFYISTIKFATYNFSDANKLGQGVFGVVTRAHYLTDKK
ncbi:hypothetical protein LWI28_014928 [Acer negundo]|uniref:Gnk2-homologous domain-containing protein n=1 Tax=Acer negundo TaxID=4023 RepID=A0AAD5JFT7_ACENE|nr:hypothetical protein LWI28_014928 [Acer negundo]